MNVKERITNLKVKCGLCEYQPITDEEYKILKKSGGEPNISNGYANIDGVTRRIISIATDEEAELLSRLELLYKVRQIHNMEKDNTDRIKTIRNIMIFFCVMAVIGALVYIFS